MYFKQKYTWKKRIALIGCCMIFRPIRCTDWALYDIITAIKPIKCPLNSQLIKKESYMRWQPAVGHNITKLKESRGQTNAFRSAKDTTTPPLASWFATTILNITVTSDWRGDSYATHRFSSNFAMPRLQTGPQLPTDKKRVLHEITASCGTQHHKAQDSRVTTRSNKRLQKCQRHNNFAYATPTDR